MFVELAKVRAESERCSGVGLPRGRNGERAERTFHGWETDQPWMVSSRMAGSWFVRTACSNKVANSW
jgi:hypothetical protein